MDDILTLDTFPCLYSKAMGGPPGDDDGDGEGDDDLDDLPDLEESK